MKLYKVLFADGSYFDGGNNYKNTKWLYIPKDKEIKQAAYEKHIEDKYTIYKKIPEKAWLEKSYCS